jgi:hypothetical protein
LEDITVDKKQHIYEVCVIKRAYHYVYVKADNMDDAEEIVIDQLLDKPDDEVLEEYLDDSECEVVALDRIKKPSKAIKTIN